MVVSVYSKHNELDKDPEKLTSMLRSIPESN